MKDFDIEERASRAVRNFEAGYNCAQSVFLAYSDVFELDMELAKKMSLTGRYIFRRWCRAHARDLRNCQRNGDAGRFQISCLGY